MSGVREHPEGKPHAHNGLRKRRAGWISLQPQPLCFSLLSLPVCPWGRLHQEGSLDSARCSLNAWLCFFAGSNPDIMLGFIPGPESGCCSPALTLPSVTSGWALILSPSFLVLKDVI